MRPQLPGLGPIATLMLVPILAVWLGFWGPVDFSKLVNWQPLLAACIVFAAGALAYQGSMAKVDHDRQVYREEKQRRRLNLFLKTSLTCRIFGNRIESMNTWIGAPQYPATSVTVTRQELVFEMPTELNEAWDNLDVYPHPAVMRLANIRSSLETLTRAAQADPDASWTYGYSNMPLDIRRTREILDDLQQWCRETADVLEQIVDASET